MKLPREFTLTQLVLISAIVWSLSLGISMAVIYWRYS